MSKKFTLISRKKSYINRNKSQVKLGWKKYLVLAHTHVISPFKCAILLFTSDVVNNEMVSDFKIFFLRLVLDKMILL